MDNKNHEDYLGEAEEIFANAVQMFKDRGLEALKEENKKLKEQISNLSASVSADVWSPQGLLNILDNYDLTWNEALSAIRCLKEENEKLREASDEDEMEEYKRQGLLED